MFGVSAARTLRSEGPLAAARYGERLGGGLLLALGGAGSVLALCAVFVFWDSWFGLLAVALPLALCGLFATAYGFVGWATQIELAPEALRVTAPSWRLIPALPVQRLEVAWSEVQAVRHRTERYHLGLPWPQLSVDVYAIETAAGRVVLGDYFLSQLAPVLTDIANRAGCRWVEDPAVALSLLATLWRGARPDAL